MRLQLADERVERTEQYMLIERDGDPYRDLPTLRWHSGGEFLLFRRYRACHQSNRSRLQHLYLQLELWYLECLLRRLWHLAVFKLDARDGISLYVLTLPDPHRLLCGELRQWLPKPYRNLHEKRRYRGIEFLLLRDGGACDQ
jgi:hypothetical protein